MFVVPCHWNSCFSRLLRVHRYAVHDYFQAYEPVLRQSSRNLVQWVDVKVKEVQGKAVVQVTVDIDNLEASKTPESISLGAVSHDQTKDRTDRVLVTPWLKSLYWTSLEMLKN